MCQLTTTPANRKEKNQGNKGANQWKQTPGSNTIDAIWKAVDIKSPNECWPFKLKSVNGKGYGRIRIAQKAYLAHRAAFEAANGSIPPNKFILHNCNNPICCNPSHLRTGTHAENMEDAKKNGKIGGARINSGRKSKNQLNVS